MDGLLAQLNLRKLFWKLTYQEQFLSRQIPIYDKTSLEMHMMCQYLHIYKSSANPLFTQQSVHTNMKETSKLAQTAFYERNSPMIGPVIHKAFQWHDVIMFINNLGGISGDTSLVSQMQICGHKCPMNGHKETYTYRKTAVHNEMLWFPKFILPGKFNTSIV